MKLNFQTVFDRNNEKLVSNSGNRIANVYQLKVNEDGTHDLDITGTYDLYAEIQSHKQATDIHDLIRRYKMTGDATIFSKKESQYGDFTQLPKTYAEVLQRVIDARAIFDGLSAEDRAAFNNSAEQFLAAVGSDKWNQVMGIENKNSATAAAAAAPDVSEEVGDDNVA